MKVDFLEECYLFDIEEDFELFIPISGFEGLYEISNYGRIKALRKERINGRGSLRIYDEKILKCSESPNGYLICTLSKDCKCYYFSVHKLTAIHFVKNVFNKPIINHKDTNKLNNFYKNLEWVTHSENSLHSVKNGLQTSLFSNSNQPVKISKVQITKSIKIGK